MKMWTKGLSLSPTDGFSSVPYFIFFRGRVVGVEKKSLRLNGNRQIMVISEGQLIQKDC